MMFTITKEFTFSAAHSLPHLPASHPCSRVHGHNYLVRVGLRADTLKHEGWVRDYGALNELRDWLLKKMDHQNLNDLLRPMVSTAEMLAWNIYTEWADRIPELAWVEVSETPLTTARYEP